MKMHNKAMQENQSCKITWEMYFSNELLREKQYTLVTRMLHTYSVLHSHEENQRHSAPSLSRPEERHHGRNRSNLSAAASTTQIAG